VSRKIDLFLKKEKRKKEKKRKEKKKKINLHGVVASNQHEQT